MRNIKGKVAWITGAGSGMGRAAALSLAEAGAQVVLSGRREDRLAETAAEVVKVGPEAMIAPLDVANKEAVNAVASDIEKRFGQTDILVNSAGLNVKTRTWAEGETAGFDKVMAINVNGSFYCTKAVLPKMRVQKDGLIINISSWAGRYHTNLTGPAYSASKAALIWLNESLNMEECINGIRAVALNPGEVSTEILDNRPIPVSQEDREKMVQADDMGDIILFLASLPEHVCINELTVSPTWNRGYVGALNPGNSSL
ncbi:MAG: SDR family oxidoreductase [Alphaproteobacteria bacterium]|nr:SDR family oxidoreductase [Alphaproteobacteria bacterium]MBT5159379.1 SDR family oxidoreductase [Alphaproteobacteria bacterium]MBT5918320.1 SDR family oxidoreductase [Alphaproteobacteria bacterium]